MTHELPDSPDSEIGSEKIEHTRRPVNYQSLSAVLDDARFLASHPHQTVGNWSFGKILQHLADSYNNSFDGFDFKVPIIIRFVVRTFFKQKFLHNKMSPGYKLPKQAEAKLPSQEMPVEVALGNLKQAISRFEREEPRAEHPVFGKLTPEEWLQLHLRHSELHMSFVKPV